MPEKKEARPFLVQIYFVLATLIGLILIVISGVNISRLVLNQVLGVKDYPEFSAPYPPYKDPNLVSSEDKGLTDQQRATVVEWEKNYNKWLEDQKSFNSADQNRRRQIAEALAMLIVGVPVFVIHAPSVFRRV